MSYPLQYREFFFQIPNDWVDRSMIAWSAPQVPGKPVTPNVLIAYDKLVPGEDLPGYVNRQLRELMSKGKGFCLDLRRDVLLNQRPAVEVIFQWDSGHGLLKQRQIYSLLSGGRAISLVNTALAAEFAQVESVFLAIIQSFGWVQGA